MTLSLWAAFVAASSILLVISGPTVLLVGSYALDQGWRTALPMATGVALGDFTAMTVSMLGLGLGFDDYLAFVEELEGALARRVDIVTQRSLSPHFRPYIEAEARPL